MLFIIIISFIISLLSAFVGSLMGLGGGIILVPIMLIIAGASDAFAWATPQAIVGISLIVMVFTALSSTLAYLKVKRVDYKTGFLFLSGSIPGGVVGSWINQFIDENSFLLYFGIFVILLSILLFINKKEPSKVSLSGKHVRSFSLQGETYYYRIPVIPAFALAFIIGTLSGLFGIGGGSMMVPAMILLFGVPVHIAAATSMFMVFFTSISGSITHISLGHVPWEYVFFFIPGAWIGGKLGAKLNQKLSGNILEWILRILLIIIGIRMVLEGLG